MDSLFVDNDTLIEIQGLQDPVTGSYENSATCTARILDTDGTTELVAPFALSYVASSNGDYRGTLAGTESLVDGDRVIIEYSADAGAGKAQLWRVRARVVYRDEADF